MISFWGPKFAVLYPTYEPKELQDKMQISTKQKWNQKVKWGVTI